MTRSRGTSSRRKSGRRSNRGQSSSASAMAQTLVSLERQQIQYGAPATPDILYPRIKQHVFSVSVGYNLGSLTVGTTGTAGAYSFSLNALSSVAAFTGCFDRYKVIEWNLQFNPVSQSVYPSSGPLFTCIDYDDANTPTAEISQRDTSMAVPIGRFFERTLRPRIAIAAYTGGFNGYANMPGDIWMDVASPNVQYYGVKYYSTTSNATAINVYAVSARVHLIFKNNF